MAKQRTLKIEERRDRRRQEQGALEEDRLGRGADERRESELHTRLAREQPERAAVRLARHAVDDEVASGDNQRHADETGQGRHLADQDHGQEQSEHGLIGVDGAEHREVRGSQRVPEEQVTGDGQHDGGQDVRPEIDTQRTERHASQEWQRERGQQSMRRDDGQERVSRALRELLLKDVGDRVGDDRTTTARMVSVATAYFFSNFLMKTQGMDCPDRRSAAPRLTSSNPLAL